MDQKRLIILLISLLPFSSFAQNNIDFLSNTFYAEAGGPCILYSINYDRLINYKHSIANLSLGIGASYTAEIRHDEGGFPSARTWDPYVWKQVFIPFRIQLLLGESPFYGGIGASVLFSHEWSKDLPYGSPSGVYYPERFTCLYPAPFVSFRYQRKDGGLFYSFSLCPVYYSEYDPIEGSVFLAPGISIGYSFKGNSPLLSNGRQ